MYSAPMQPSKCGIAAIGVGMVPIILVNDCSRHHNHDWGTAANDWSHEWWQ